MGAGTAESGCVRATVVLDGVPDALEDGSLFDKAYLESAEMELVFDFSMEALYAGVTVSEMMVVATEKVSEASADGAQTAGLSLGALASILLCSGWASM